jgi:hypothetical protein
LKKKSELTTSTLLSASTDRSGALLLKESEKKRLESKIERELEKRDKTFEGLSLQEKVKHHDSLSLQGKVTSCMKKALKVNEEAHSGQFWSV